MSLLSRLTGDDPAKRAARLSELETRIEKARYHMAAAAAAGEALQEIRDTQLYRETHNTFEQYVESRWGLNKRSAYELMSAADVLRNLAGVEHQPTSIRQALALAPVPADQQPETWAEALAASPVDEEGTPQPTGEIVAAAAQSRTPRRRKAKRPKPVRLRIPGATVTIERNKAGADKSDADLLAAALAALDARRSTAA